MYVGNFRPLDLGSLVISGFRDELLNERYVSWLNDPDVVRYSEQRHKRHSIESCSSYVDSMRASNRLFLSIETAHGEHSHIGNISVFIDAPNRAADLSIMIGDKVAWGRGYASMAWNAVIQYLLYEADLRRVTAGTMEVNLPMIRLIKRSGMHIDCVRPRHFLWEDREIAFVGASRFR
jgi:ribosomal-protein-alanine N-acetyltransferase